MLYTKAKIPLDELRRLVEATIDFLKNNKLINGKVYRVWDWFEHDRYLPNKEIVSEKFLTELTKNNEKFYLNHSGDTYVKLGLYDEFSKWYLRIYIIDEYDLENGEEMGGTFDISSNEELIQSLFNYLKINGYDVLQFSDTKMYFEKRYV